MTTKTQKNIPGKRTRYLIINAVLIIACLLMAFLIYGSIPSQAHIPEHKKSGGLKLELYQPNTDSLLPDTLVFNDFELTNDINNLLDIEKNVEISPSDQWFSSGKHSARIDFDSTRYCEIGINYTPPWWDQYDSLCFDLYFEQGRVTSVSFRIGDFYTPSSYCDSCQKFRKSISFKQGWNHYCFAISEIASLIDINSRFKSIHLGFMPKSSGYFFVDRFRLVKND